MEDKAYTINEDEAIGTVQIADDVVAVIAGLAATEVDGVSSMAGNISHDLMSKMGYRSLTKGVKTDIVDGKVKIEMSLTMSYGYNIPATCSKVQEKIKSTIENMTGLEVSDVNIRIAGVDMQKGQ